MRERETGEREEGNDAPMRNKTSTRQAAEDVGRPLRVDESEVHRSSSKG